MMTFGFFIFII